MRALLLVAPLLLLDVRVPVQAQEAPEPGLVAPGTWQAYPAMRRVRALASGAGAMWGGTDGGLFRYDLSTGEIKRFTTVDGLASPDVRSLLFDERHDLLWIGYQNGVIDRLNVHSDEIATFYDIARTDRYPQRGINRFRVFEDDLLIATDFGIVLFDIAAGEVVDTFDKFADLDRGQPTFDIVSAPLPDGVPGFWVGTRDGVAYARQDAPNLRVPSAWTVDTFAPSRARALAFFNGTMYLGRGDDPGAPDPHGDVHRRVNDGSWTREFISNREVPDLVIDSDRMVSVSLFNIAVFQPGGSRTAYSIEGVSTLQSAAWSGGGLWLGTLVNGLARLPSTLPAASPIVPDFVVTPPGPASNEAVSLGLGVDGDLWIGLHQRFGVLNGMSHFDGTSWKTYSNLTGFNIPMNPVRDVLVDRRGMAWGAMEGGGLMRVDQSGEVRIFDSSNSPLEPEPGHPGYVVSLGVVEDAAGRVWVTNRNAMNPLHVWSPDDGWTSIARPPGTPHGAWFGPLFIDRFEQKWVGLIRTTPGFIVIRTDPNDLTQAEAVSHTGTGSAATGTGLPSQHVTSIVEDHAGRIWIGTQRGLAVVFSPGSIFANPALAVPSWARTADQASYFLRDLRINAMDVDPSGRLWLASSDGVWLLNAQGNAVEAHFTPENSPLPSASVVDVAVDGSNGTVWFATDAGVMSYRGVAIDPSPTAERLRVYPNPYRPAQDPFVRVEGLVAETRIRVLTADGQVVAAFDGRGGSATWDGRDQRTGQLVPSGVYIVSAAGLNGEGTAHARIAVIR